MLDALKRQPGAKYDTVRLGRTIDGFSGATSRRRSQRVVNTRFACHSGQVLMSHRRKSWLIGLSLTVMLGSAAFALFGFARLSMSSQQFLLAGLGLSSVCVGLIVAMTIASVPGKMPLAIQMGGITLFGGLSVLCSVWEFQNATTVFAFCGMASWLAGPILRSVARKRSRSKHHVD